MWLKDVSECARETYGEDDSRNIFFLFFSLVPPSLVFTRFLLCLFVFLRELVELWFGWWKP